MKFHDHQFLEEASQKRPSILEMINQEGYTLLFQHFVNLCMENPVKPENIETARFLIDLGKRFKAYQKQKEIIYYLSKKGKAELLPILLSEKVAFEPDEFGKFPFHYLAAMGKSLEALREYMPDTYQGSEIEKALQDKNLTRLRELCDAKLHLKCVDKQGRSALHHAVIAGDMDVFKTLLEYYKRTPLPFDYEGKTPLHDAVLLGKGAIILQFNPKETLFDSSVPLLRTFYDGLTNQKFAEIEVLLQAGFIPQATSKWSVASFSLENQPLGNYFAEKGDLTVLRWLKQKKLLSDIDSLKIFQDAISSKKPEVVEFILGEVSSGYYPSLSAAISTQVIPIIKLFLDRGILLSRVRKDFIEERKGDLEAIAKTDNPAILELILQYLTPFNQERFLKAIYPEAAKSKELKLIRFFLQKEGRLKDAKIEEVIQITQKDLGGFEKLDCPVFMHLSKNGKTVSAWRDTLALIQDITCALARLDLDDEEDRDWMTLTPILTEIFDYVFGRLSSETSRSETFLPKLATAIRTIKDKTQIGFLFNGLKTQSTIESIEDAIDIALLYFQSGVPSKKDFAALSASDQKKWLHYISTARLREGLELCFFALKHLKEKTPLLAALSAIEKIAVPLTDKQSQTLEDLLDLSRDSEIRIGCLRALWETLPDPLDRDTRDVFFDYLKNSTDLALNRTLIELLCNYQYDRQHVKDREILDHLVALSYASDLNTRVQSALSLSQVLDEPCLLRAAEIVQSSDWESYDSEFRQDEVGLFAGDPFAFIKKPDFQDNRASMLKLIQDQLAEIYWQTLLPKVEERYAEFIQTPEKHPHLQKLKTDLESLPGVARYLQLPIYFPTGPDRFLFRGMTARKGEKVFFEAARDLIRKGCGSSDLSYFEARFDFGTWSKVGHIFGSHDVKTANLYSKDKHGVIICFSPEYYNSEYRKRHARLEIEGSINTVNYRGIPKHAIRRIYLPASYRSDFEYLYSERPLEKVKLKLRTEVFKDISNEQLMNLRRFLREPIPLISHGKPVMFEGKPLTKPYFTIFSFYSPNTKEEIFSKDLNLITVEDVHQETLKRAIGRELIQKKYAGEKSPSVFMAQDEMLHQLTDADFKAVAPMVFEDLIKERERFQDVVKGKNAPKPLRQHVLELIIGSQRYCGLKTELQISSISLERCRASMRLAALYYFSGKLSSQPHGMLPHTLAFADQHLTRHANLLKIDPQDNILIHSILEQHRLFKKKLTPDELKNELGIAWKNLTAHPHPISQDDYVKILHSFYAATVDLSKISQVDQELKIFFTNA